MGHCFFVGLGWGGEREWEVLVIGWGWGGFLIGRRGIGRRGMVQRSIHGNEFGGFVFSLIGLD